MESKTKVLEDIQSLIQDIDKCEQEYIKGLMLPANSSIKAFATIEEMSRLLEKAHQELTFLYGRINVLYGLWKKADEVYFRAGALSADMNSAKALREAREAYWHYVNYEMKKEGGK